ncbi:unnamed protein product [Strongylus vulgaris]|uniref:Uncharacterized protein n=1 Tax=Strongylus vulgaris TaxID=40348 RepID=A0A3P7KR11_STRVU|nr:unnamed protein product [Strongylus vulgaris]
MSGIVHKIRSLIGFEKAEVKMEGSPPKDMSEIIARLPESFHKYMRDELPYRRAAAVVFIAIVLGMGTPLWYHTTQTYRAPFETFSVETAIPLSVK